MRETSPVERAMFIVERLEREIKLMKDELAALLPADHGTPQNYITDPLSGKRRFIKR